MMLARILERNIPFSAPPGDSFLEADVAGCVASHFGVSPSGTLSYFCVDSGYPRELDIAVALAAKRKTLDDVEWCLVPKEKVEEIGVGIASVEGVTCVKAVNDRHVDVTDISLGHLTKLIMLSLRDGRKGVVGMWDVAVEILDAIDSGIMKKDCVNPSLMRSIEDGMKGSGFKRARKRKSAQSAGTAVD